MQRNFEQPIKQGENLFISAGLERKESVKFGVAVIHLSQRRGQQKFWSMDRQVMSADLGWTWLEL